MEIERRQVTKAMRLFIPQQILPSAEPSGQIPTVICADAGAVINDELVSVGKKQFPLIHLCWIIPLVFAAGVGFAVVMYENEKKMQRLASKYKPAPSSKETTAHIAAFHAPSDQGNEYSDINISTIDSGDGIFAPRGSEQFPNIPF